ncbi:hypothetical protein DQ397_003673 [Pseudomonas sp. CK-NBRI-02]|nr:hypothetical protein DQ397_003673 [Pseudomonas sp. CK-NBRI-02]
MFPVKNTHFVLLKFTGTANFSDSAAPVGAGSPANTGQASALYRVAFFAGKPAPQGRAAPREYISWKAGVRPSRHARRARSGAPVHRARPVGVGPAR